MPILMDPSNNCLGEMLASTPISPPPPPPSAKPSFKYKKMMSGILSPRTSDKTETEIKRNKENWLDNNFGGGEFQKLQKI